MGGTTILPPTEGEKLAWSLNFEQEFPGLAGSLGFTNADITELLQDAAAMRHGILTAQVGAAFSKACTAFKNRMLGGVGENQDTPLMPVFTAPPSPPTPVDAGIVERLSKAMNTAKLNKSYSQTIGETLQIATVAGSSFNPAEGKPTETATAMTGSIVRIDWKKGAFDGIYIESQRDDEDQMDKSRFRYAFAV